MLTVAFVVSSTNLIALCVGEVFLNVSYKLGRDTRISLASKLVLFEHMYKYWLLAWQACLVFAFDVCLHWALFGLDLWPSQWLSVTDVFMLAHAEKAEPREVGSCVCSSCNLARHGTLVGEVCFLFLFWIHGSSLAGATNVLKVEKWQSPKQLKTQYSLVYSSHSRVSLQHCTSGPTGEEQAWSDGTGTTTPTTTAIEGE